MYIVQENQHNDTHRVLEIIRRERLNNLRMERHNSICYFGIPYEWSLKRDAYRGVDIGCATSVNKMWCKEVLHGTSLPQPLFEQVLLLLVSDNATLESWLYYYSKQATLLQLQAATVL